MVGLPNLLKFAVTHCLSNCVKWGQMEDEVIIKHKKGKEAETKSHETPETGNSPGRKKLHLQYKIISILLTIISVLLLISLITYNPLDESTAQFSGSDIMSLFSGDEYTVGLASQVHNRLGVVGAMLSYALYRHTVGYAILLAPLFIFLWARELTAPKAITESLPRYTTVYLVASIMFAAFMGAMQQFGWGNQIPGEWSGAIGLFIGSVLSSVLTPVGAVILTIAGLIMTFVIGIDVSRDALIFKLKKALKDKNENEDEEASTTAKSKNENEINIRPLDEMPDAEFEQGSSEEEEQSEDRGSGKPETKAEQPTDDEDDFIIDIAEIADDEPVTSFETRGEIIPESTDSSQKPESSKTNDTDEENENEPAEPQFSETTPPASPSAQTQDDTRPTPLTVEVEHTPEEEEADTEYGLPAAAIHDEEIDFEFPSFDLLDSSRDNTRIDEHELKRNSQIIRETFETFKILIEKLNVTPGPVVTQYEFVPARGVKVSKINSYADDVAMALKAKGIRIIAPIPGKGTVGIEIPNSKRTMIRYHDVANTMAFAETKARLPLALGKTISGETYITDLAKMPHLLIAGTTGSGKSVGMNTIITSLLYKKHPSELKFVIIDPKRVEMNQYNDLQHLYMAQSPDVKADSPIINDPDDAIAVLQSTVKEMENRYKILESVRLKSISEYNEKIEKNAVNDPSGTVHRKMPYIVVIVDELADLMMSGSKKEIEFCITRLAQMARAVGIHLVIATQRPSTDVITGLIKANFPARIAYTVNSGIDSRTILDQSGAEKLIGYGDMLCMPPGIASPVRVQNAYIDTDEIEAICNHILNQEGYSMPYMLPSANEKGGDSDNISGGDVEDRDELFEDAARLVVENQIASVSMVQRRLKVGYARAGRIIDQLEEAGIVGKFKGSKSREVLLASSSDLEAII